MQTKVESLIEKSADIGSGFVISYFATLYALPLFFPETPLSIAPATAGAVTLFYTVISFARGYAWRRLFNNRTVKKIERHAQARTDYFNCEAFQLSDMMHCGPCSMSWDTNDPNPPACRTKDS